MRKQTSKAVAFSASLHTLGQSCEIALGQALPCKADKLLAPFKAMERRSACQGASNTGEGSLTFASSSAFNGRRSSSKVLTHLSVVRASVPSNLRTAPESVRHSG